MAAGADDVVIVGMACRYPEAHEPTQLWQNVMSRRRSFRPIPPERLPLAEYGGSGVDQTYLTRAAVLDGWSFDRQRFRVPGDTFRAVDLTHWLALDVSAAALADAGLPDGEGLDRRRTGVVLGNSLTGEFTRAATLRTRWPYVGRAVAAALAEAQLPQALQRDVLSNVEARFKSPFPQPSDETLAGGLSNTIAGRICNYFDFQGSGYTVDAACASSLLAVCTAAEAVASGRLDVALAGGVDLSLDPFELVGFARVGALAREDMRVYDARPTGFLPGEGCGVVVLCRSSHAQRAGLRPYARLLGWATSSDGSGGLTRPDLGGQRLALTRAYAHAELDPHRVALVEGHGTGTAVGDETELRALVAVRGTDGPPAVLGTIKANIGHTKAAAGVAGIIKATLALYHEVLPPTTGCVEPHPLLAEAGAALRVTGEALPWPSADRYASVSAMGFGGINVHVILGGAAPTTRRGLGRQEHRLAARHPGREVVVCSAGRPDALAAALTVIRDAAGQLSQGELTDLAASLASTQHGSAPARFAAAVASAEELVAAIEYALSQLTAGASRVLDRTRRVFLSTGAPLRVGLLFPGQAAPAYPQPGVLADLLDRLPAGYRDELVIPADTAAETSAAQPAIVRASLAGLRWLDTLGARAHWAVGHSLGELAALVWAGALTEDEAYMLATVRGAAMAAASAAGRGGMASLHCDLATATDLVGGGGAVIAADNSDQQVVVSGPREDVTAVLTTAGQRGIASAWLPVSHSFHSPVMAAAAGQVRQAVGRVAWKAPAQPVASTITGGWWSEDDPAELLVRQLTGPVRFREAIGLAAADLMVEVGPGQILTGLTGDRTIPLDAGAISADAVATVTAALFAAGAVDGVEPYFSRRFTRSFDLARARQFLANPCEAEPLAGAPVTAPASETPPVPPAETATELDLVLARVATTAELDATAIGPHTRLLADLHLNSLRVSQLATEVASELGRAVPEAPLALATATVGEFAAAIAALPAAEKEEPLAAPGVGPWVRVFCHNLVPRPAANAGTAPRDWNIVGDLRRHPLAAALRAAFPAVPQAPPARLLALPTGLASAALQDVVTALRACAQDKCPLVVVHHRGVGAAVGRSLTAENPDIPVLVVEVPPTPEGIVLAAVEAHRPWHGYAEVIYPTPHVRTCQVARPMEISPRHDSSIPLRGGEVCLVTGGAKGIGAECAAVLAKATGARLVLLGRSPIEDPVVAAAVRRISGADPDRVAYHQVDLTDAASVTACLTVVRDSIGPVRGVLHAAGRNQPALIADLSMGKLAETLGPKADGFEHVLSALDLAELCFAVTFGSVIGRTGLVGESDYAIANEWLARRCAELAETQPEVRWLNIEWSAWMGAGMGVRLHAIEGLIRQGLSPIPVEEGTDLLLRLLATPTLPTTVLVAGRLPVSSTLCWDGGTEHVSKRFLEVRRSHTPGVELVAEATLSLGTDPYLSDHRIDGVAVLPAVFGLEAMAQACTALGAKPLPAVFREVGLTTPITVPERGNRTVRIATLAREDGRIRSVIRSEETRFAVNHFSAEYDNAADDPPPVHPVQVGKLLDAAALYGPLFFHGPRFQRVRGFHGLSAFRATASISAQSMARWYGAFQDQRLELGDPGARDAFLHALQGCVPDRRVLPVGVDRVTVYRRPDGWLTLDARQRDEDAEGFVFDLVVSDAGHSVVEEWRGLRLRAVGPIGWDQWPVELLGPFLTRSLRRWRPDLNVDLCVAPAARTDQHRTRAVAAWLTRGVVDHTSDGRLVLVGAGAVSASASHLDTHLLVAAGTGQVAVDWERVGGAVPLDPTATAVAAQLCNDRGEAQEVAACRVWTCREAMRKLGLPPDAPLVSSRTSSGGWAALESGDHTLYSTVVSAAGGPIAVCLGMR